MTESRVILYKAPREILTLISFSTRADHTVVHNQKHVYNLDMRAMYVLQLGTSTQDVHCFEPNLADLLLWMEYIGLQQPHRSCHAVANFTL